MTAARALDLTLAVTHAATPQDIDKAFDSLTEHRVGAAISAKEAQNAAHALGKSIYIVHASAESELEPAFATIAQLRAGGLLIAPDGLFIAYAAQVAALSLRHAIPASHERRAFPDAGGLMSYGANQADGIRLAGVYTAFSKAKSRLTCR